MSGRGRHRYGRRGRQHGLSTVEFAISAAALMVIMLGALEMGRLLYTWNTLDRIAQRAARIAAVCPPNHGSIAQIAGFGAPGGSGGVLPDFTSANLQLNYFDEDFNDTGGAASSTFVRAQIVGYTIDLSIPFVNLTGITSPTFSSTVPAESLGWVPDTGSRTCFGTA